MIIDFHCHIFSSEIVSDRDKYLKIDPVFQSMYANVQSKLATAEDLIRNMDEQHIGKSVIQNLHWVSPQLCRQTNEYIIQSVSNYPEKLAGFGAIPLDSAQNAIREIEYCASHGLKGIGELRFPPHILNNDQILIPVISRIVSLNLVLCIHTSEPVGHLYPGKGDTTPALIYSLIKAFPELKLVCSHWGGGFPFYALMPEVRQTMQNVYFDCAASPYLYSPKIYQFVASLVGSDRILFGSDYPLLKPARLIREINGSGLDQEVINKILCFNTQQLLGI